jgi:transposase
VLSLFTSEQIFLVTGATDMRKAFRGLPAIVENVLGRDPLRGIYVFCNSRRNRLKILFWQKGGYWVCAKRLELGSFGLPDSKTKSVEMTPAELALLLGGVDVREVTQRRWYQHAANE